MKYFPVTALILISVAAYSQDDSSSWDDSKLSAAASASYLSQLEKEVVLELNKARTDPAQYSRLYIEPTLKYFDGKIDTHNRIQTNEGAKAVKDCVAQMKRTHNMELLNPDEDLSNASLKHTSKQSKTTQTGHTSPNGETFEQRLKKIKFTSTAECISYGANTARDIVVNLLVDDGVPDRGHRKIILNPNYSGVGVSAGGHKTYGSMCTLDFGGGFLKSNR